jgi:hypothetical protein
MVTLAAAQPANSTPSTPVADDGSAPTQIAIENPTIASPDSVK